MNAIAKALKPSSAIAAMVLVALALAAGMAFSASARADLPPYGIETFDARTTDADAAPYTVAGGHPYENVFEYSTTLNPEAQPEAIPVEQLKDTFGTLPLGFFGNPVAAPRCSINNLSVDPGGTDNSDCSPAARVGVARLKVNGSGDFTQPIWNLIPERGYPAQFAFRVPVLQFNVLLTAIPLPRTESYGLTINNLNALPGDVTFVSTTFFGVPAEHGSGDVPAPFLSNPVDCAEAEPTWRLALDSWQQPGSTLASDFPNLLDPNWKTDSVITPAVTGCEAPSLAGQFDPHIAVKPLQGGGPARADQPTGLAVDLEFPQSNDPTAPDPVFDPETPQAPEPKDITTAFPAGLSISPSSARGQEGCSDLASDPVGDQVHYDTTKPVTCPSAAKIGTATAISPLVGAYDPTDGHLVGPEPIPGDVYLLKPHPGDLPVGGGNQDGKFRLLIQLEQDRYGVNFKLPGVAVADKSTGRITATFAQNPQLPASKLHVELESGPLAPLVTPVTCGRFDTTANFVPWGTPGVPDANKTASFDVTAGPNGSACAATPGQRPFAPSLSAGTTSNAAGQSSPFVLHLARADGEQELSSLQATLPKGLAAKFTGIPYCSDAALAAAAARSGKAEQSNPSCPASRIGSVTVGAGPGTNPFHTQGTAYLAGPYKGAPMSVAVITPAVAGPFDLGTVVVRNALYVDPETAQGRVVSDPFPKIIDGVPLKLRSVEVNLDRPSFTLNPTNCSAMTVNAKITSTDGASSSPTVPFQVGGCKDLGFKPDLKLSLKGDTKRSGHPALKATLNYPKGNYANIAKAVVSLPHSEFLAQNHIKTICTRVQFAAKACPAGSIYGYATATTPLLDAPLSGPVYLRSSSNPLPDLVAALHGQIDVDLVGRIDSKNGGIRTTFESVPDAPVSKFTLTMQGGKKGLLENSKDLCNSVNKADVKFTAQNGKTANYKTPLTNRCKKAKKGKGAKKGKAKAHKRTISWLPGLGF